MVGHNQHCTDELVAWSDSEGVYLARKKSAAGESSITRGKPAQTRERAIPKTNTPELKASGQPREARAALNFLAGGGEMGERTRAFEWSKTPVGPVAAWPRVSRRQ